MRVLVFLVDRDPAQRETICRGLFVLGHLALPACSLAEARRILASDRAAPPDLLLTDVTAADRARAGLVALLGLLAPSLPVLVITGTTDGRALAALRAEGTPVLAKPFTPEELDSAVRSAAVRRDRE